MGHLMRLLKRLKSKFRVFFGLDKVRGNYWEIASTTEKNGLPHIRILRGEFTDCVFAFTNINVIEDGRVEFDCKSIHQPSDFDQKKWLDDKSFIKLSGEIFIQILEEAIENYKNLKQEVLSDEEDRTDYIEELTPERTFRKRSSTTSKKRVRSTQKRKSSNGRNKGVYSKVQPPSKSSSDPDILGEQDGSE